jgi:phosphatidylglycerophosphate synthase
MLRQAVLTIPSTETALARVAGLPLVVRNARALVRAGARHVVLGPCEPEVIAALDAVGFATFPRRDDAPALEVPCDRVFEPALAARALAAEVRPDERRESDTGIAVVGGPAAAPGRPLELGPGLWAPCTTPAERREAERRLLAALRKPVDGPVSRWVNRPISLSVTRLLLDTRVTPNQMTLVATAIGVLGIWAVLTSTWPGVALGAVLVNAQSILDGCDGEIARLKFQSSPLGAWLDNVLDDLVNAGFGFALGVASANLLGQPLWRWLGAFAAGAFGVYYAVVYAQLALRHHTGDPFAFRWWFQTSADLGAELGAGGAGARTAAALRALARRDVFLWAFMLLALARLPQVAVAWYAVLGAVHLGLSLVHLARGGLPAEAAS